jgi:hypothetical protein
MNMFVEAFKDWKFVVVESKQNVYPYGVETLTAYITDRFGNSDFFAKVAYVFVSNRRKQIKIVFWDGTGFSLLHKKLQRSKQTNFKVVNLPICFADFSLVLNGFSS